MNAKLFSLLLLCLLCVGCASPERRGMLKYLHSTEQAQNQLVDLKKELVAIGRIELKERLGALNTWRDKVKSLHAEFAKLEVPPAAKAYNDHLEALFQTLEDYGQEMAGQARPDKLKECADRWTTEQQGLEKELNHLRV